MSPFGTTQVVWLPITAEDIAQGRPSQPGSCPIALALKRHGFAAASVLAGGVFAYDRFGNIVQTFDHGPGSLRFLFDFDRGSPYVRHPRTVGLVTTSAIEVYR